MPRFVVHRSPFVGFGDRLQPAAAEAPCLSGMSPTAFLGDDYVADPHYLGPLGNVPGQQREGCCPVVGLYSPPEAMSAGEAGGRHAGVPKGTLKPLPCGECSSTLVRLVLVI